MQRFGHVNGQRVPLIDLLVAFFSFLRISILVPYSLADLHSDKAYFLKRQDVSFTTSGAVLGIGRTKTIQSRQRDLEVPLLFIPNSALCHVIASQSYFHLVGQNLKQISFKKWHLTQNQPSLRQIFKEAPFISFKRGISLKDMLVKLTFKAVNDRIYATKVSTVQESCRPVIPCKFQPKPQLSSPLPGIRQLKFRRDFAIHKKKSQILGG